MSKPFQPPPGASFACVICGADAPFGLAPPLYGREAWFCRAHVPPVFWRQEQGRAA